MTHLGTCDQHRDCIVVYDEGYPGVQRNDCPICKKIAEMEEEARKLQEQIDELEEEQHGRDESHETP
jgi:hypothetical protein